MKKSWPHGNRASTESHAINRRRTNKMAEKKRGIEDEEDEEEYYYYYYYKNTSRVYFSSRTRSRVNLPIYFMNRDCIIITIIAVENMIKCVHMHLIKDPVRTRNVPKARIRRVSSRHFRPNSPCLTAAYFPPTKTGTFRTRKHA